ncbi:MAG TPA: hypothetical protein PLM20_06415 [Syntrophomonadaceae bacterium]|nr:hypothetical protein [Syntrophomonadaceae bacterium]HQE23518.1 hypothetical protein [Syntrophomonadaceae bacterium]
MTLRVGLKGSKLKSFKKVDVLGTDIGLNDEDWNLRSIDEPQKLFLGRFSEKDINNIMQSIGLIQHLDSLGFSEIHIDIDRDVNLISHCKLYWQDKIPENLLIDLRVSEHTFLPHERFFEEGFEIEPYHMILIEWLSAQNPRADFDPSRPQLPGQMKPGLGVLKYCFQLLYITASEVFKDGFLDIPTHMHGAMMYSKAFKFFDPVQEAILRAVMRDLRNYSLSDISWGVITETIIDLDKDRPAVYDPGEQIHYVSKRMKKYFESPKYVATFNKYYRRKKYRFDYEEMVRRREQILQHKKIEDL